MTAKHVGGLGFNLNGTDYTATQRIDHPTADISLLRFSNTFTKYSLPFFDDVMGQVLTFVGFGATASERTAGANAWTGYDYQGGFGTRRAVTNRIEDQVVENVGGHTSMALLADLDYYSGQTPLGSQDDFLGGGGATANEGGVIFGDSGGGSLLQVNGEWRIAGVNIWISDTHGPNPGGNSNYLDYGDVFAATSIHEYRDWIRTNAPETVPEPATMAALGLGVLALLKRRRSKI
ncbi:MAG: PEP-CTERM sorting domain-containing protein [Chlorobia bacterium]|nr:PEP-CTERM sorting domain-containing protein [Fimbriimonadaceae bacterium]